jgi:pantoate--beta-alanine ligase
LKKKCDVIIVSIFVNKKQFGPNEDFINYPRTLEKDLNLLKINGFGDNIVFIPDDHEIYPHGDNTIVKVEGIENTLEGFSRPK